MILVSRGRGHIFCSSVVTLSKLLFHLALQLLRGECPSLEPGHKLSFGCPILDALLRGGITLCALTELAGESGTGKTQFGLQLCLSVQYPIEHGGLGSGKVERSPLSKEQCEIYGKDLCGVKNPSCQGTMYGRHLGFLTSDPV